ncbi:tRNA (cytidine(34)-2'-O)-methyltransferase [Parvularcula maris]|uniref:tRNA (cytidine(34)-2'-O)-methyltransferase n=1 Tax=Parvularcula maris TaxID=2965077 RepID=A0A9X2RK51_9PROT|nr:TrmH family RNA methyltransferase [Parvularcula maris]MCQ8185252.1 tRNA (cytidine(34)-2'-O)-methyltransferase [Parvularcula maris]
MPKLALYQPEIAANLGAIIRSAACFGAELHVIEPCGFPWREREIGKAALDYQTTLVRHVDWDAFRRDVPGRLVLMTTRGSASLYEETFTADDIVLMGQESAGVPPHIHEAADARIRIPLAPGARSLNVGVAAAVTLSELRRQTGW